MKLSLFGKMANNTSEDEEIKISKTSFSVEKRKDTKARDTDNDHEWKKIIVVLVQQRWKESLKVLYEDFKALIGIDKLKYSSTILK